MRKYISIILAVIAIAGSAVAELSDYGRIPVTIRGESGNDVEVNTSGQMHVVLMGQVDTNNSTTVTLDADEVFTGPASDILDFGFIFVSIKTDVASATNGLLLQLGSDGVNWDNDDAYTITAGQGEIYAIQPGTKFFRLVYTNGSTTQSYFRVQTVFKKTSSLASSHPLGGTLTGEDDAQLMISALVGEDPDGIWRSVKVTSEGRLDVSSLNEKILIASGEKEGWDYIEKFGRNSDIDGGSEYIWSRGGAWVPPTQARVHDLVSTDVDDAAGDTGARSIDIQGLDTNWDPISETITMNGTTNVPTTNSYVIIHRMEVMSCGSSNKNEGTITATAQTDGTVTSEITIGKSKTTMAIYGVKRNAALYLEQVYGSINASANPTAQPQAIMELKILKMADTATPCEILEHVWGIAARGTSSAPHPFLVTKRIGEKSIVYIQTESTTEDDTDISAGFDGYLRDE